MYGFWNRLVETGRKLPFSWLVYDTLVYGAARYLNVVSAILLTPIYTRLLTKDDYGIIEIFVTWNMFMSVVITLGLPTALQRFYWEVKDDPERKRETIGTLHGLMLGAAAVYAIALLPFRHAFLNAFNAPATPPEIFYESIALVVLTSFFTFVQTLHQAALRKYYFAAVSVLNFAIVTVLGFFLVYVWGQGVVGFFRASVVALVVSCVAGLFTTTEVFALALNRSLGRQLLSYSMPFIGVFFLFQSSNVLDRFLVTRFLSLEAAGVFSVANKIAGLLSFAISSFSLAWFPYAMQIKESSSAKRVYAEMFLYYVAVATLLVNAIAMFRTEIISVFAPAYSAANHTIAVLCLCYIVAGSVYVLTLGLHITEQTRHMIWPGVTSVAVNVVASVALVQVVGLEGIAYGSLLGSLVWVVLQVRKAQRLYRIPFTYRFCLNCTFLTLIVVYGGPYLDAALLPVSTLVRMGTKVSLLSAVLAVAYLAYVAERRRGLLAPAVPIPISQEAARFARPR